MIEGAKIWGWRLAVLRVMLVGAVWRWKKEIRDEHPDEYMCCAGTFHDMCGCGGITNREAYEAEKDYYRD